MSPIPCAHCGINFMRNTTNPNAPKLCNSCILKEENRNPKKERFMQIVEILIKCPQEIQVEIEEYCINQGMDFSKYFLSLHDIFKKNSDFYPKDEALLADVKLNEIESHNLYVKKYKANKK